MKLIADSGSTSTDWRIIGNTSYNFRTIGLHPFFTDKDQIKDVITNIFPQDVLYSEISQIFFYGTGCKAENAKIKIQESLQVIFPNAEITIESDLVGAAKSLFGNSKGIACILGTGMNVGVWNGTNFDFTINSLGYIIGDEGSGADLGKQFIKTYLENELSVDLQAAFSEFINLNSDQIIQKIYKDQFPNRFLASFAPFLYRNKSNSQIETIISNRFQEFIIKHLLNISKNYDIYNISVVGSIGFFFQDILASECAKLGITLDKVIQNPIESLSEYHS